MHQSISNQLTALAGYAGHVEISPDFQLLENTTPQSSEVMAEVCGVLIGYLKAQVSTSNRVLSISVVFKTFIFFIRSTKSGYILLRFEKNQKLSEAILLVSMNLDR
jgi:hypothetical protein